MSTPALFKEIDFFILNYSSYLNQHIIQKDEKMQYSGILYLPINLIVFPALVAENLQLALSRSNVMNTVLTVIEENIPEVKNDF